MTAAIAAGRRFFPRGYADFGSSSLIWFGFLLAYQVARGVADRDPVRRPSRTAGGSSTSSSGCTGSVELTLQGWTQSSQRSLETLVSLDVLELASSP